MKYCKKSNPIFYLLTIICLFTSCDKVDITFEATSVKDDPNITYFDSYETAIATSKPDSFITSSHQIISLGYHTDPVFGIVKAASFAQLSLPSVNPLYNINKMVTYDSLELILRPSGKFYGDSTKPVKINIFKLTANIKNDINGDLYYNTSNFSYNTAGIGQGTINANGKAGSAIHIKLSDAVGLDMFTKFLNNANEVSSQANFIDYFKGIYINTDSVITNSVVYFSAPSDSTLVKIHYHENGVFAEKKEIELKYTAAKQFNNISFRHTTSNFSSFIVSKKQLISSNASGNQSYLNSYLGAVIKISFSNLLQLKQLHPYVKVVKAMLVIKPDTGSYSFPYQLPQTLNLYTTDDTNYPVAGIYDETASSATLATGYLSIDKLYNTNTNYSFDITRFINTKIEEGEFSKSALLLYPSLTNFDNGLQRLILNGSSNNRSVQLKLYVLGL